MFAKKSTVFRNAGDGKLLAKGISEFAVAVYNQQKQKTAGNMILSPLSISSMMSLTSLGARGNTLVEMMKTLSFFGSLDDKQKLHETFGDLVKYLAKERAKSSSGDVEVFQLYLANRVFIEESFKVLDDFKKTCIQYYDSEMAESSFVSRPLVAVDEINAWISEKTNKKIQQIITLDLINPLTRLVLVGAIYFKSLWDQQFKPHLTEESDFFISSESSVKVPMMFQTFKKGVNYGKIKELSCQAVELPFETHSASMFILLPDKSSSSLEDLEKKLSAKHLIEIDGYLKREFGVKVWIPKFRIEDQVELKEILKEMGMKDLFSINSANLSGIDAADRLYASNAIHKAFIDVNEEGTEAAGATLVTIEERCASRFPEPRLEFRADHPFLFFIRENASNIILFIGRVMNPLN